MILQAIVSFDKFSFLERRKFQLTDHFGSTRFLCVRRHVRICVLLSTQIVRRIFRTFLFSFFFFFLSSTLLDNIVDNNRTQECSIGFYSMMCVCVFVFFFLKNKIWFERLSDWDIRMRNEIWPRFYDIIEVV